MSLLMDGGNLWGDSEKDIRLSDASLFVIMYPHKLKQVHLIIEGEDEITGAKYTAFASKKYTTGKEHMIFLLGDLKIIPSHWYDDKYRNVYSTYNRSSRKPAFVMYSNIDEEETPIHISCKKEQKDLDLDTDISVDISDVENSGILENFSIRLVEGNYVLSYGI